MYEMHPCFLAVKRNMLLVQWEWTSNLLPLTPIPIADTTISDVRFVPFHLHRNQSAVCKRQQDIVAIKITLENAQVNDPLLILE